MKQEFQHATELQLDTTNMMPRTAKLTDVHWHPCAAHPLQLAINAEHVVAIPTNSRFERHWLLPVQKL